MKREYGNLLYTDRKPSDGIKPTPVANMVFLLVIAITYILVFIAIFKYLELDRRAVMEILPGIFGHAFLIGFCISMVIHENNYHTPIEIYETGILMPVLFPPWRKRGFIPNEKIKRIYPYWRLSNDEDVLWIGLESLLGAIGKLLFKDARHQNKIPWMMGVVVEDVNGRKLRIGGRSANRKRLKETIKFLKERFPDKFDENYYELDKWDIYGLLVGLWGTGMFFGFFIFAIYSDTLWSYSGFYVFLFLMYLFVGGCGFSSILASKQQRIWGEKKFGKENCHR